MDFFNICCHPWGRTEEFGCRQRNLEISERESAINANEIAEMLSVKAEEVRYRIKLMKKLGEITRRGATKAGEWEVIK